MIVNADTINNVYNSLISEKITAADKTRIAEDYEAILKSEIALLTTQGEVIGKNAEERKAFIDSHFAEGYAELRNKQRSAEIARLQLEISQIEVSRVNTLVRYMECMIEDSKLRTSILAGGI
jgi:cell division protein FtsL